MKQYFMLGRDISRAHKEMCRMFSVDDPSGARRVFGPLRENGESTIAILMDEVDETQFGPVIGVVTVRTLEEVNDG